MKVSNVSWMWLNKMPSPKFGDIKWQTDIEMYKFGVVQIKLNPVFPTYQHLFKILGFLIRGEGVQILHPHFLLLLFYLQLDINQLMMTSVNVSQSLSPTHRPTESPGSGGGGGGGVGGPGSAPVEQSPVDRTKGFFPDESEPLLRCDSTSSKDSALSRNGSFITKGKQSWSCWLCDCW